MKIPEGSGWRVSSGPRATGRGLLVACVLAGMAIGLVGGGLLGYSSIPLVRVTRSDCAASSDRRVRVAVQDADHVRELLDASWGSNLELAARIGSFELLREDLERQDVSPSELVESVVRQMSADEIYSRLDELTSFNKRDLEDVEDVHGFAARLATIALEGTFEPGDEDLDESVEKISFATERELDDPSSALRAVFSAEESSIYAIVPVGDRHDQPTLFKWIRIDRPQIITFRRISLRSGGRDYFSYGIHRPMALEPGQYRVEVYAADDALTPIARGSYAVQ